MTNKENNSTEHEGRVNWLVSLRSRIIETQTELRALSNRQAPTDPGALVAIEIAIATLEQQESKLTQQYREELLAHVLKSEVEG